jgi:hypothetical protein
MVNTIDIFIPIFVNIIYVTICCALFSPCHPTPHIIGRLFDAQLTT